VAAHGNGRPKKNLLDLGGGGKTGVGENEPKKAGGVKDGERSWTAKKWKLVKKIRIRGDKTVKRKGDI